MRARMKIENPGDVEMTLKVTMKMKEWEELRDQLGQKLPSWRLSHAITTMMLDVQQIVYSRDEPDGKDALG